jgi:glycosyltransferase involved in cell wall biosynthesis
VLKAGYATLQRALAIRRTVAAIAPELILSFLTRPNVLTLAATFDMQIPVIVSERSHPERQHPGPAWAWLRNRLYPRAARMVVMTEGARDCFPARIATMTTIIPNPVVLPPRWRNRRRGNQLVAVGRLEKVKGFDVLLRVFRDLAPRHPEWSLTIWGEGPEREALEKLRAEFGLLGRVHLPGVTNDPGLWVETADAFVLTSHYEGWPNALAEAMAAGLPVVSIDCPHGPSDMIRHRENGLLAAAGDSDSLQMALDEILSDAAIREALGLRAAISAGRFAPDQVMAQWEKLVADAILGRDSAPKPESAAHTNCDAPEDAPIASVQVSAALRRAAKTL